MAGARRPTERGTRATRGTHATRGTRATRGTSAASPYARIWAVVRRIPVGRVATYGQVAALAGWPGRARQVGYALHALAADVDDVPWQRVVNARGEVSPRAEPGAELEQRALLEAEGVRFDARGRIDLARFGLGEGRRRSATSGRSR